MGTHSKRGVASSFFFFLWKPHKMEWTNKEVKNASNKVWQEILCMCNSSKSQDWKGRKVCKTKKDPGQCLLKCIYTKLWKSTLYFESYVLFKITFWEIVLTCHRLAELLTRASTGIDYEHFSVHDTLQFCWSSLILNPYIYLSEAT